MPRTAVSAAAPAPTPHRGSAAGQGPHLSPAQHHSNEPSARHHVTSGGRRGIPLWETTVTKSGSDYLKRTARETATATGRRYPDVLAELRHAPRTTPRQPSKELVLVCNGIAHPIDGGRCARAAGHRNLEDGWGWCGWEPNDAVHVWAGYHAAKSQAQQEQEDARRAALTPEEREAEDAEMEHDYNASMGRDPYDPYDDKYELIALELQDEEHSDAEEEDDYSDGDWS